MAALVESCRRRGPVSPGFVFESTSTHKHAIAATPEGLHDLAPRSLFELHPPVAQLEEVAVDQSLPPAYAREVNITRLRSHVEVGTRRAPHDLVTWLPRALSTDDFVALKVRSCPRGTTPTLAHARTPPRQFDVDEGIVGETMEWGFLADLVRIS